MGRSRNRSLLKTPIINMDAPRGRPGKYLQPSTSLYDLSKMRPFHDKILYDYAMSFIGRPYRWGGDDPMGSFDCSGLVLELLYSCGMVPTKKDMTAQGIYNYFEKISTHAYECQFGNLVFYGKDLNSITHIAFGLDQYRILEAGGGGPHVKTLEDAIKYNAFIRIRGINNRMDRAGILKPSYVKLGYF